MSSVEVSKERTLIGHKDCIYTVTESPYEEKFISAAGDGMVVLWEICGSENGQLIAKVPNSVYCICPINELKQLVVGQNYEGIHIIDILQKTEIASLKLTKAAIFDIHYSDGRLYVGTADGVLTVIDYNTLTIVTRIKKSNKSIRSITSNRNHLAVGYSDNFIRIFNITNMEMIHELDGHTNSVFALKYTSEGDLLLSGSRDAHLKIWDKTNYYHLKESVIAHMYTINSIDIRSDQHYIATCSMDKTIKIWDGGQFKLLKVIDKARHGGHLTSVNKIFWSNYKNRLISCSDDRTISIWDLKFNEKP